MNILLCGADGFLGRAIASRLETAGHWIVRGVHRIRQAGDIALDYQRDLTPETWLPRLQGVDAVINAVGILREATPGDFERVHHRAPAALFQACAQAGIRRVIQISAVGPTALTSYLASKHAADAALLQHLSEGATVLRPTLIFGEDGASSRFFLALASLPFLFVPQGIGKVQPVHIDDLTAAVEKTLGVPERLESDPAPSRILDFPGPRAQTYGEWLEGYRKLMGLSSALHIPVPAFVMAATARLAGCFSRSLLCRDTWTMLAQGNVAEAGAASAFLDRPLRDPADFAAPKAAEGLRLRAFAFWRHPLLLGTLAAIWLLTALLSAGIFPIEQSLALLAPFGLHGKAALFTLMAASGLDAAMGFLTLLRPGRRLFAFQLALVLFYSLSIAWRLPEFLSHPFAPVLKNLAIAALLFQLIAEEKTP
ncbi:MAG: SDR family oxidoreductase [Zoogloeaceae bacterium]|jgi:uncharacterized protein YbjT (DUF2867 family)|nr:SDR family oxidoreductase [Zoogloeaceae bacterium]